MSDQNYTLRMTLDEVTELRRALRELYTRTEEHVTGALRTGAGGPLDASKIHCALCMCVPCRCPAFGSAAYFALINFRHGRTGGAR